MTQGILDKGENNENSNEIEANHPTFAMRAADENRHDEVIVPHFYFSCLPTIPGQM